MLTVNSSQNVLCSPIRSAYRAGYESSSDLAWHPHAAHRDRRRSGLRALRTVTLPAAWEDGAAAALAALAPGDGPSAGGAARSLVRQPWAWTWKSGCFGCCCCVAPRRPRPTWSGRAAEDPGFVLNLPAFLTSDGHFDVEAFAAAVETAVEALVVLAPAARRFVVGMADLSPAAGRVSDCGTTPEPARDVARCLAAVLRGHADAASARSGESRACCARFIPRRPRAAWFLAWRRQPSWRRGPKATPRHLVTTAIRMPGAAEALLGVETGGIAPCFAWVSRGWRSDPHRARLAWRPRHERRARFGDPVVGWLAVSAD